MDNNSQYPQSNSAYPAYDSSMSGNNYPASYQSQSFNQAQSNYYPQINQSYPPPAPPQSNYDTYNNYNQSGFPPYQPNPPAYQSNANQPQPAYGSSAPPILPAPSYNPVQPSYQPQQPSGYSSPTPTLPAPYSNSSSYPTPISTGPSYDTSSNYVAPPVISGPSLSGGIYPSLSPSSSFSPVPHPPVNPYPANNQMAFASNNNYNNSYASVCLYLFIIIYLAFHNA